MQAKRVPKETVIIPERQTKRKIGTALPLVVARDFIGEMRDLCVREVNSAMKGRKLAGTFVLEAQSEGMYLASFTPPESVTHDSFHILVSIFKTATNGRMSCGWKSHDPTIWKNPAYRGRRSATQASLCKLWCMYVMYVTRCKSPVLVWCFQILSG